MTDQFFECQLLNDHNEIRKKHALPLFKIDNELTKLANNHIYMLVKSNTVYHGNIPQQGLQNIAKGKKNLLKPNVTTSLWCNHEPHEAPIIKKEFTKIGIGYNHNTQTNDVLIVVNYS
jgi:uncharacterized protein YkwD